MPKFEVPVDAGSPTFTGESTTTNPYGLVPFHTVTIRQEAIPSENKGAIVIRCHMPEEVSLDTTAQYNTPFADLLQVSQAKVAILSMAGFYPLTQSMTSQFWSGSAPIQLTLPLTILAYEHYSEVTDNVLLLKSMQVPRVDKQTKTLIPPGPRIKPSKDFRSNAEKLVATGLASVKDMFDGAVAAGEQVLEGVGNAVAGLNDGNTSEVSKAAEKAGQGVMNSVMDSIDKLKSKLGAGIDAFEGMFEVQGKISIKLGQFLYFDDVVIEHVSDAYNIVLGPDGYPLKCQVTIQAVTRMTPTYENLVGNKGIYQVPDPTSGKGVGGLISSVTDHLMSKSKIGSLAGVAGAIGKAAGIDVGPTVKSATQYAERYVNQALGKAVSRIPAKLTKR